VETAGSSLDVRAMVVYDAADDGVGSRQDEHVGLLRNDGQTPKQAYLALQTLGAVVTGLRAIQRVPAEDPLVTRYRFDRGNGLVTDVVWSDGWPRTVTLDAAGPVAVTDLTGNQQTVPSTLGQVVLGVGTAPVYATYQATPSGTRFIMESNHTLAGAFLQEWLAAGGLDALGLPLS